MYVCVVCTSFQPPFSPPCLVFLFCLFLFCFCFLFLFLSLFFCLPIYPFFLDVCMSFTTHCSLGLLTTTLVNIEPCSIEVEDILYKCMYVCSILFAKAS